MSDQASVPKAISSDDIRDRIYTIRGVQVMLDSDLAQLYHIGASIKDAGKKAFEISLNEDGKLLESLR